jgi:hypothetical protein
MLENVQTVKGPELIPDTGTEPSSVPVDQLDSDESTVRLNRLRSWFHQARTHHAENRYEQSIDRDFYDGDQWDEGDAQILRERGQSPLVYNKIKPAMDWIIGTEKRTRVEGKCHPRGESDVEMAQVKTKILKYVNDINKTGFHRSLAFADAVLVGVGWLEDGVKGDGEDDPIFSRHEDWRRVWNDPLAVEPDNSDSRYLFRGKWIDLDIALAMFPGREEQVRQAAKDASSGDNDYDEQYWLNQAGVNSQSGKSHTVSLSDDVGSTEDGRERVWLVEAWYKMPVNTKIMRDTDRFNGLQFDQDNPEMEAEVNNGASLHDAVTMAVRTAIFCDSGFLQDMKSPYRHNRFALTPIYANRRGRDNASYGAVRNTRDPQRDMNKRASKALHILSPKLSDSDFRNAIITHKGPFHPA